MTSNTFIEYIKGTLDFLGDILTQLWSFLSANIWLLSMVLAPFMVSLIIFGVKIAFSFATKKNDDRKGER